MLPAAPRLPGGARPEGDAGEQGQRRPAHIVDLIKNNEVSFIVNTVEEKRTAIADSRSIRTSALAARVTFYTTSKAPAPPAPACASSGSWKPMTCKPCMRRCNDAP